MYYLKTWAKFNYLDINARDVVILGFLEIMITSPEYVLNAKVHGGMFLRKRSDYYAN